MVITQPMLTRSATVNHTGRRRITADHFKVEVDWQGRSPRVSRVEIEGDWSDFETGNEMVLEVWQRSSFKEIKLGTPRDFQAPLPAEATLDEFDNTNPVNYRIMLVSQTDSMLSACSADHNIPSGKKKPQSGEDFTLLAVQPAGLSKGVTTRISFPDSASEQTIIFVNDKVPELEQALQDDTKFDPIYALTIGPYVQLMAHKVISEVRENRSAHVLHSDPSINDGWSQTWQGRMHMYFAYYLGVGSITDIDYTDKESCDEWVKRALYEWSQREGNPARDVKTMLLGGI